jgi:fructose-specific phosphotransferase system IIC component
VAGFFLLSQGANLFAADFTNPLVAIVISMVAGAVLGYVSEKIGVALSARRTAAA